MKALRCVQMFFRDIAGTLLGCCCVWQRRLQAEAACRQKHSQTRFVLSQAHQ